MRPPWGHSAGNRRGLQAGNVRGPPNRGSREGPRVEDERARCHHHRMEGGARARPRTAAVRRAVSARRRREARETRRVRGRQEVAGWESTGRDDEMATEGPREAGDGEISAGDREARRRRDDEQGIDEQGRGGGGDAQLRARRTSTST